jgi:hypothetical protein
MFKKFILEVMGALETRRFIALRLGLGEVIILFVGRWGLGSGMRWALNWDDYKEEVVVLESAGVEDIGEALERVVGLDVLRVVEGGCLDGY